MTGSPAVPRAVPAEAEGRAHRQLLARELLASALYVTLVLLAALVAVPSERLPSDRHLVGLILGTSLGLLLAHWFAFRLAAHITTEQGHWSPSAAQEAAAQLVGGLAVASLAAAPFVFFDSATALSVTLWLLAALPAVAGFFIARLRGSSRVLALASAAGVLALAVGVVVLKNALGH